MATKKRPQDEEPMNASAEEVKNVSNEFNEAAAESRPAQPAAPTDFPMSLEEYGISRGLAASVTAGLKAFLRGDARPRKRSAWDRALGRFEQA